MSGSIEEIPLPDLIQLLSTSRKSGVLFVRTDHAAGRLFLRKGQIYFANLENNASVSSRKAIMRMLSWAQGSFELEPPDESPQAEEMEESTEALLMEGMRQLDEYRVQLEKLPPLHRLPHRPAAARAQAARPHPRGAGRVPGRARGRHDLGALRQVFS